mmetsp:Transcript_12603/g.36618  ORF Transcript_12603/g.36618 Transcript_12603/m.36618 type:complete len:137 (-) Transcript_12603:118-528(-)|eukprot:CAMPEP_0184643382 /NCGR_PEP_ID=MMETSP0308-20130426/216_1 /TAXON_ID=38269 /ORGANISM="Gloeochaete witrockiana, Strain SAG 46.84" /LENGTH=136 /DNA_ID=CAMNT_0027071279 /DNA_START=49 /DNA_END=459 /DNA_ORIENTATION=-
MQIFVRSASATAAFDVNGSESVAHVRSRVAAWDKTVPEQVFLTYAGQPLEDNRTLGECGIDNLATLEALVPVLGGKVHGSLARAGKVRGQTPKVPKQEKKKKKTGRAKRRDEYNRRFVNVVVGFGKKRGPNSNVKQ